MRKRFTEEQITGILNSHENGMPIADILRQHGISEQTFYRWKSKYGGMEVSDAKRLKQLVNSQINYEKIFRLNNLRWHI